MCAANSIGMDLNCRVYGVNDDYDEECADFNYIHSFGSMQENTI